MYKNEEEMPNNQNNNIEDTNKDEIKNDVAGPFKSFLFDIFLQ